MKNKLIITADDFGLTRGVSDSILEAADRGAITDVAVLANGDAMKYALEQYKKRSDRLHLSIHLNLTEGPAISQREQIPFLADKQGLFSHSFVSLWVFYFFSFSKKRKELRGQIEKELSAQIEKVRSVVGQDLELRADGHQHVHMLPFVFDELLKISSICKITSIRIPTEPLFIVWPVNINFFINIIKNLLLNILGRRNRLRASGFNIEMNDYFLGVLNTGQMTDNSIENGFNRIAKIAPRGSYVEIGFHPGSPICGEEKSLEKFKKSYSWYVSFWRERERMSLESAPFKELAQKFKSGGGVSPPRTWLDFWNKDHKIYVSSLHKKVHYEAIGRDVLALLPKNKQLTFLDFGCGDALCAPTFASAGLNVLLYDPTPLVRERIKKSFLGRPNITVLDKGVDNLKENSVDVILINSVLQYISKKDFEALLPVFKKILKPSSLLIIADVVPPDSATLQDVISLMRHAWKHGYVFPAIRGLATTLFSDYRSICREQGFTTYSEKEMLDILSHYNFRARREGHNIGLTAHRMTFCAK